MSFGINSSSAFSIDWDDYRKSRASNLVGYLQYLSTHEHTDTPDSYSYQSRLNYKKSAIGYLLATGGPNGFSGKHADEREKTILLKALSFAAFIHESLGGTDDFDLMAIRHYNGLKTVTEQEKAHLLIAQTALVATRILIKAGQRLSEKTLIKSIDKLYKNDCLPILRLTNTGGPVAEAQSFAKTFTKDLANRLKVVFEDIMDPLSTTSSNTIPLVCYSEGCLQDYITKICLQDAEASRIHHKPLEVTLQNGLIILRKADGTMILKSNRKVNLGRVSLFPSSFYQAPRILHAGPLLISKYQDENELLASLEAISSILSGDTRKNGYQVSIINTQEGYFKHDYPS